MMFGDHLGDAQSPLVSWQNALETCDAVRREGESAGGDADVDASSRSGDESNSHMLMQDKNSLPARGPDHRLARQSAYRERS